MTLSTLPLAITMGDPAGIGPEIIAKLAATERLSTPYVVIGDAGALARAAASLGLTLPIRELPASLAGWDEAWRRGDRCLFRRRCAAGDLPLGRLDKRAGAASYAWVVAAIDLALAGRIAGIVTAPLNKEAMRLAGIDYPGHTEILAARSGTGLRHDAGQRRAAGDPGFHSRFAAGRHRRGDRGKRAARVSSGANGLSGAGHSETAHCGGRPESARRGEWPVRPRRS